jgi:hypothetical protein
VLLVAEWCACLVQQLVYQHEVVLYGCLCELCKVRCEQRHQLHADIKQSAVRYATALCERFTEAGWTLGSTDQHCVPSSAAGRQRTDLFHEGHSQHGVGILPRDEEDVHVVVLEIQE